MIRKYLTVAACLLVAVMAAGCSLAYVSSDSSGWANPDKRVRIINQTGQKIMRFYGSHVGTDSWEEDILGQDVLQNGGTFMVNFSSENFCLYDFKAVLADGSSIVQNRIDVCQVDSFTFAGSGGTISAKPEAVSSGNPGKRVRIINETGRTITRFYGSHVGTDSWEEDILGQDVLHDGGTFTVNFSSEDYCLYDFKAVFEDGTSVVRNRINVCEVSVYRYSR